MSALKPSTTLSSFLSIATDVLGGNLLLHFLKPSDSQCGQTSDRPTRKSQVIRVRRTLSVHVYVEMMTLHDIQRKRHRQEITIEASQTNKRPSPLSLSP